MMVVVVNGEERELDESATVADVLALLEVRQRSGVAVARNGELVMRTAWESSRLRPGDRVEVLHAVQGG